MTGIFLQHTEKIFTKKPLLSIHKTLQQPIQKAPAAMSHSIDLMSRGWAL